MNKKISVFFMAATLALSNTLYASDILDENNVCKADGDTVFAFLMV